MATIGAGVSLRGMEHNEFHYPFNLAAGTTAADVGKPVALDATAANTVKIAGDGETVIGKLVVVENRAIEGVLVGTVALKGGFKFSTTGSVVVGGSVQGAGGGNVKPLAANYALNMVVEVGTGYAIVVFK